jgi:hypothetical protein
MKTGYTTLFDFINVLTLIGLRASEENRDVSPEELKQASDRLGAKITALEEKLQSEPAVQPEPPQTPQA